MMYNKKYLLLSLIFFVFFTTGIFGHAFYVSLTDIAFKEETQSMNITIKIFSDDLIKALKEESDLNIHQDPNLKTKNADTVIFKYLRKHFTIAVNGRQKKLFYVGKEVEIQATWCYLQIKNIKNPEKIAVFNDILTEQFPTQKNVVKIDKGNEVRSMILNKSKVRQTEEF